MKQGRLILAAGCMRSKEKELEKHEIPDNFVITAHVKNIKNKKKSFTNFPGVFDAGGCIYHFFSRFPPARCLLQRRNHERYSWISAVLTSAIKRYCRELSIEYFSLPKIGGVCEISSKENEGYSSLLLKAPHMHT